MSFAPLFMKGVSGNTGTIVVAFWIYAFAALGALGLAVARGQAGDLLAPLQSPPITGALLVIALFYAIDIWAYVSALKHGADVGVMLAYVRVGGTIATAILGIVVFGERLSLWQWAGIALAATGIIMLLVPPDELARHLRRMGGLPPAL